MQIPKQGRVSQQQEGASDLAAELGEDDEGSLKSVFGRVIARIGHTQATIVIDEVQHCLRNCAAVLEELRDITDTTETMAVLVTGVEQVQSRIGKHAQISSRRGLRRCLQNRRRNSETSAAFAAPDRNS